MEMDDDRLMADSERRCVATRSVLPIEALVRFVVDPDGRLVPDIRRKLPGRGAWTALSREAVEHAVRTKAFARSLRSQPAIPDDLPGDVDRLLVRDALQSLSFANKAGLLVSGYGKVEAALTGARMPAVWIEAADGAADGRRKLLQALWRRHGDGASALPLAECFTSDDLGLALGRDLVVHAAVKDGAAARAFLDRWRRLMHFRTRTLAEATTTKIATQPPEDSTAGPTSE